MVSVGVLVGGVVPVDEETKCWVHSGSIYLPGGTGSDAVLRGNATISISMSITGGPPTSVAATATNRIRRGLRQLHPLSIRAQ